MPNMPNQGSQKVLPGPLGQEDFLVGQVDFPCHLSGILGLLSCLLVKSLKGKLKHASYSLGKQNLRATCLKGKLEFKYFSSPAGGSVAEWLGRRT